MYVTERDYWSFHRARISMSGPETEELIRDGLIETPYPEEILTIADSGLGNENYSELLVLVPIEKHFGETIEEVLSNLRLKPPEPRHAIRFISQFDSENQYGPHAEKNIIFPHEPYVSPHMKFQDTLGQTIGAPMASVLTSAWRPQRKKPELVLWNLPGRDWTRNAKDFIAGVAEHLRQEATLKRFAAAV